MSDQILPDVIVIGAMKAGTTSLYEHMSRHGQIGVSAEKETDFFVVGKNWSRGLDWYHSQFRPGSEIYAEASPNYTKRNIFAGVPERIAETIPDCKFIFLTRDPVRRAESEYRHIALSGTPTPDVRDLPKSQILRHLIDNSSYAAQLDPYLTLFPRENFLILEFEALVQNPRAVLSSVAGFLGVRDEWSDAEEIASNSAESLARLPPWVFALRETRLASALKRRLSRDAISQLKSLVSKGRAARRTEPLPREIKEMIAAALTEDQIRLTKILNQAP
ncbi:sulfotransferase domain-containing protein [Ruegeria sp. 2012CJ41-6]|uniref:Sulfotransferase domain-containing protein n=1 Tax=Ruegeria spongiae TaxID=2942209 RepID=A0ABT0Q8A4_9RHOB|nr:sulfotransferase [Ruegeria spongiae]MCL6285647.1 sulfotransferase domain-containing protein [Ruegeria spongiae]